MPADRWNGLLKSTHGSTQKPLISIQDRTMTASSKPLMRICTNCDRPAPRLGRLNIMHPTGKRFTVLVCRFCFLQLSSEKKPRLP
jgi:hypothetical protein